MISEYEIILRLLAGTICGMLIGLDREWRGMAAGLRTMALVGLGASVTAVAAIADPLLAEDPDARSRVVQGIIQGVLTGVGFIGAGVILRNVQTKEVEGLTTAAAVWVTAALGIAAGLGAWRAAITGTILGLVLLVAIRFVEKWMKTRAPKS